MSPRWHDELQARRVEEIAGWLNPAEEVLDAGPAQWVVRAQVLGRGGGERVLYVTSGRLLWRDDRSRDGLVAGHEEIEAVSQHRILMPGMRKVTFRRRTPAEGATADLSFYTGKHFASALVRWAHAAL